MTKEIAQNRSSTVLQREFEDDEFKRRRDKLSEIVNEPYKRATPDAKVKTKGEYPYAEYDWMLQEFHKMHPRYEVELIHIKWDENFLCYDVVLKVTDLETGFTRVGGDNSPVAISDKDLYLFAPEHRLKLIQKVRHLRGNALKSAITKAFRHTMSNFGIAADVYKIDIDYTPFTPEQRARFEATEFIFTGNFDKIIHSKMYKWWESVKEAWDTQTSSTADAFLDDITTQLNNYIERKIQNDTKPV